MKSFRTEDNTLKGGEKRGRLFSDTFLIKLILPLLAEQLLVFAIGMTDSIMVAGAGEAAVSAVSLVDAVMALMMTIMTALATGGAVVVGQLLGQGKPGRAREAADQLFLFMIGFSLVLTVVMQLGRGLIIDTLFGAIEEDVERYCVTYYVIVISSIPFIAAYNAGVAVFRSMGNSGISMRISIIMNIINIGGNSLLMLGLGMGVEGVAIPTLLARAASAFLIVRGLRKPGMEVGISTRFVLVPDMRLIKSMLRIGVPNGIENSMFQIGKLVLLSLVSGFGTVALTANAVSQVVAMVCSLPGMAVGYGMVSVLSRCVGTGDYGEVKFYTVKLVRWAYMVMIAVNLTVVLCLPLIMDLYGLSEETTALARKIIIFHSVCACLIWPLSFSVPNVLRAAGDVMYTMVTGITSMWLFRIMSAYLLGEILGMGVFGVWVAMIVDWIFRSVMFIARYRSGKWKYKADRDLKE